MENLTNTYLNTPSKFLVTDLNDAVIDKDLWSHARNTVTNSHKGDIQFLQNEPSNWRCVDIPYDPIGFIKLINNEWVVFTTDDASSEIGIFNEDACTYKKVVNANCLNFNRGSLIRGAAKQNFDGSQTIYWTDGKRNPRRKLNLSKIPYTYTFEDDACQTKVFTNQLDCNELLMSPKFTVPCINATVGPAGSLKNGTYQFAIAYTLNKQRITDYYGATSPKPIFSPQNIGQSIVLDIKSLDREFEQYELIVIYTIDEITTAKVVGYFSTVTTRHQISNINKVEYVNLPLEEVVTKRPYYYYADDVVNNDQYLLWGGVTSRPELNYQLQAFDIATYWVSYQVPTSYYADLGDKVGYLRDEVYAFGIQWLFDAGEWSSVFHIPGRVGDEADTQTASGKDVYENKDLVLKRAFEVYDTSKDFKALNTSSKEPQKAVAEGLMGYHESTTAYPDNVEMFGEYACTPIRHHKFPTEATAPRYKQGGQSINILGVRFENIEHPKDKDGNYLKDIVGYRIVRSDREGNRSVIAKGVFTNVRSYKEGTVQGGGVQEVLYPNYPFNDLKADPFISSKQTYYKSGEKNFRALADFKLNQFNFYGPHALFGHVSLGDEVVMDTEESALVTGFYEKVYQHPGAQLLSNYAFYLAIIAGAIDGVLNIVGKKTVIGIKEGIVNATVVSSGTTTNSTSVLQGFKAVQDAEDFAHSLSGRNILALPIAEAVVRAGLKVLQTLIAAGLATYFALKTANELLDAIYSFAPFNNYALQYNSVGRFNASKPIKKDNRRRHLDYYQYLYNSVNSVQGVTFNNFKREPSVYIKLGGDIKAPGVIDDTRQTIKGLRICDDPFKTVNTTASLYYGAIKRSVPDQYGQLDSIRYIDTNSCYQGLVAKETVGTDTIQYATDYIFGGDTFINLMSVRKTHHFFRQNLAAQNFPDGTAFNYSLYRNVAYPRYWMSSEKYDMSEFVVTGTTPNKLPQNKFNMDCQKSSSINKINLSINSTQYFYLYNSGVTEYFVESDYNLDFREFKNEIQNFYNKNYSNLSELFRSDRIEVPEEFEYDRSYSKQLVENAMFQQDLSYNPRLDEKTFSYYRNRVIYSLPAFEDQKADNWLVYLNNNFYDFPLSDFGNLTSMNSVDNQQIMFLFDKSAPYVTIGRDELQTDGNVKVTIGDAGLFAREPRPLVYTDYSYGNSQSRWAFVNTQFGSFYPSQRQGRLFNWSGKFDEVSRRGMHYWFKQYLPSMLLEQFPNFKHKDNPIKGTSLLSVFDNTDERYYISKIDYSVKANLRDSITYDVDRDTFLLTGTPISLKDTRYFDNASWTLSYSPKDQGFISWHDWHPDWTIQSEKHFMTVKDRTIWKHNQMCDSYCNFYNVDYPWEIEYVINYGPNTEILRSIEYNIEAGKYFQDCRDFHQILDKNFDELVVSNKEQSSGYLYMHIGEKNKLSQVMDYPNLGFEGWNIKYDKEEQKTRVNQFWDLTKDRGEFSKKNFPLWTTQPNGYVKTVTPQAINLTKNQFQRKKFRNNQHKIFLSKLRSEDIKFIFKFSQGKSSVSPR